MMRTGAESLGPRTVPNTWKTLRKRKKMEA